jgi:preprotein translocase subunit YajC
MPTGFLILIVLLVLMWVLLIRPQRRRQTAQNQLLSTLNIGDEVVTAGGIYGRIEEVEDADVMLEIAPGTRVRVAKRAIAGVVSEEDEEEELEEVEDADAEPVEAEETPALDASTPERHG